ncbi:MAG: hypothetical protein ACPGLV_08145 [Bacteroidia bacterium]
MFKKIFNQTLILVFVFVLCVPDKAKSQDFYHGAGIQMNYLWYNLNYELPGSGGSDEFSLLSTPGLFYKATLAFNDNFALSSYPFLGVSLAVNSRGGGGGGFGVQIPVLAEYYFGDIDETGLFVSGGFSYGYILDLDLNDAAGVFGPQFGIGGHFYVLEKFIGARLTYTHGLNKASVDESATVISNRRGLLTIGAYYPFF